MIINTPYQKFQADYLFPISTPPIPKGIIVIDEKGKIVEIANEGTYVDVVSYKGVICPGFINAHCHLELSYLKGLVPQKTGLVNFIKQIIQLRRTNPPALANIQKSIAEQEQEMINNGIVAVADIANATHSFAQKEKGNLYYHTFLELIGFNPESATTALQQGTILYKQCPTSRTHTKSLTPHAPYSVSKKLWKQILQFNEQQHTPLISLHNQETPAENDLFLTGTGEFMAFYKHLGLDINTFFTPPKTNSLSDTLSNLSSYCKILLIHNTFTTKQDMALAQQQHGKIYWGLCPNANQYIENSLPNFELFLPYKDQVVIGTDSLASNHQLCILTELKTIHNTLATIPLQTLLQWATLNGANFLNQSTQLGSLTVGKSPGINLLENINYPTLQLQSNTTIRPLAKAIFPQN